MLRGAYAEGVEVGGWADFEWHTAGSYRSGDDAHVQRLGVDLVGEADPVSNSVSSAYLQRGGDTPRTRCLTGMYRQVKAGCASDTTERAIASGADSRRSGNAWAESSGPGYRRQCTPRPAFRPTGCRAGRRPATDDGPDRRTNLSSPL